MNAQKQTSDWDDYVTQAQKDSDLTDKIKDLFIRDLKKDVFSAGLSLTEALELLNTKAEGTTWKKLAGDIKLSAVLGSGKGSSKGSKRNSDELTAQQESDIVKQAKSGTTDWKEIQKVTGGDGRSIKRVLKEHGFMEKGTRKGKKSAA